MLIYVLLAAGIVTALLEHWVDASVILAVVIINAAVGFVQEGKAKTLCVRYAKCFLLMRWCCVMVGKAILRQKISTGRYCTAAIRGQDSRRLTYASCQGVANSRGRSHR